MRTNNKKILALVPAAGLGAALALAACGGSPGSSSPSSGTGSPAYSSGYSAGESFVVNVIGTDGGGISVQQASSTCSQAMLLGTLTVPAKYNDDPGDWNQGWTDGCENQLIDG